MSCLTQIYQYRKLQQLREAGAKLNISEAMAMEVLGAGLESQASLPLSAPISGVLTTNTVDHRIRVIRIAQHGVVCTNAPGALPSGTMGLRLDDACENQSYLFRVKVAWVEHVSAEDECKVGFDFIGNPVMIRWSRGRSTTPQAVVRLESSLQAA